MSRVKQKALSDPPSQEPLKGGSDSAPPFISNTVASFPADTDSSVGYRQGKTKLSKFWGPPQFD